MRKPEGYDNTQAITGEYTPLPAGGYVCMIKVAKVEQSKGNKEMLSLALDICDGEFNGYFETNFKNNPSEFKKWGCVYRQLTEGNSLPFFKGLIESIEKSNSGYTWNWNEALLQGKLIGVIFRREEYLNNNGESRWNTKPVSVRSVDSIKEGKFIIPDNLFLDKSKLKQNNDARQYKSSEEVYVTDDDDLPF